MYARAGMGTAVVFVLREVDSVVAGTRSRAS